MKDNMRIRGSVVVELFDAEGNLKQREEDHNIVTDQGDILFASLAYTAAPTFNMKLGTAATVASKTKANNGAFISSAGSADYVSGTQQAMDATYPKAGTSTPGSGSQVVFKVTYAAGTGTATIQRASLCNSTETTSCADGTLTYAIAVLSSSVVKTAADSLAVTWTITMLGA